ncbi:MAG: LuxR C-terminal-related transcriptional regulator [Anaerolineae bacterium]
MSLPLVLPTKLRRPQLDGDLVWRAALVARLDAALEAPLTLLSAAAGAGKTTLVCQWLDHLHKTRTPGIPTAWLCLDSQDGDLAVFLPYLVAALRSLFPDACPGIMSLLGGPRLPDNVRISTILANDLGQLRNGDGSVATDFVLVLDDYEGVQATAVSALLAELLRYPPPGMHLVLVSRMDPSLPLSRLRANRQLVEIRSKDLRLTTEEVTQVLQTTVSTPLTEAMITAIAEQTEGWAAAVHLASLSLLGLDEPQEIATTLAALPRSMTTFMLDEVLARQPEEVKDALLRLSVFDRFCSPLVEAVGEGGVRGEVLMKHVRAANLFVTALDAHDEWFRFDHSFRDLLRRQLTRRYDAAEIGAIHRRGGAWFAKQGLVEEALQHALTGEDVAAAAGVFARYRHEVMNGEQWLRLDRWLRLFPTAAHTEYPDLLLARAWLTHTFGGGILAVKDLLPEIDECLAQAEQRGQDMRYRRAELDVLRGMLLYHGAADGPKCIFHTRRALDILPRDWYLVRSYAWLFLAGGYQLMGEMERAHSAIAEGTSEDKIPVAIARGRSLVSAGFLYWMEGDLSALDLAALRITALGEFAARTETVAWGHHFQACVHYERSELAAAEREARRVVDALDPHGLGHPLLLSGFVLARALQAQGRSAEARQVADEMVARSVARQAPALARVAEAFRADLMARQGDVTGASQWLAKAGPSLPLTPMPLFYAPQLTPSRILLAQDTPTSRQQAADTLHRLQDFATATHNRRILIEVLALQALLHHANGHRAAAVATLTQSLALAEPGGLVRVFADLGPAMRGLLHLVGKSGSHPDFVLRILSASGHDATLPISDADSMWIEPLTARETEVLALLAERCTTKEIAYMLVISPETVKRHIVSCCRKLHARNRREAVVTARDLGILPHVVA